MKADLIPFPSRSDFLSVFQRGNIEKSCLLPLYHFDLPVIVPIVPSARGKTHFLCFVSAKRKAGTKERENDFPIRSLTMRVLVHEEKNENVFTVESRAGVRTERSRCLNYAAEFVALSLFTTESFTLYFG